MRSTTKSTKVGLEEPGNGSQERARGREPTIILFGYVKKDERNEIRNKKKLRACNFNDRRTFDSLSDRKEESDPA